MDSFYINKIAGAVLSGLLLMVGLRTFTTILYPSGDANLSKGAITVTQNAVGAQADAKPAAKAAPAASEQADPPVNLVLASADVAAGQNSAKKCGACHQWGKDGKNNIGPSLHGVVGREIAKYPGFQYSSVLQGKGGNWDFDKIYAFIKNPKQWAPGTKMGFAGLESPKERANIIAFLNQQSDSPQPLPAK